MRFRVIALFALAACAAMLTACGGPAATNNTANTTNTTNTSGANTSARDQVKNNAPTLTPVYKAYCDAWVKMDEAALRKVYSSDTIAYLEGLMKEDKVKSLMKFLEDDKVSGTPCEVVNEEITGDKAVGMVTTNKYSRFKVLFVKENGDWKITNMSPDSVTKDAASLPAPNSAPSNGSGANSSKKND